jgi:DNA-binding NarL/FixJ family response regulator
MTSVNGNIYRITNNICRDPPERLTQFGLSRRETEILGWIVHGKTNPEIATILSISVRTIHKHVERIYLSWR